MRNIFNIILKFDIKTTPLYRSNLTLYELFNKKELITMPQVKITTAWSVVIR